MVSASYVLETAPAHTDMLASEPDRSDARRATGLTLERRPGQKATVSGGGNNSIEAYTTVSLARLLAKQGKSDEARRMLADIYGWFTEGFDTLDLKDAKALLDHLNA
jgi:predicted ATPase